MANNEKTVKYKNTKKMSIMAVDDDAVFRKLLLHNLKKLYPSSEVHLFSGSTDALNFYSDHFNNIDVVIVDMMMPDMNGLELSQKIENINKNERIILITAYSLDYMITQKGAGAVEFFLAKNQMDPTLKDFPIMLDYYIQKVLSIKENQSKRRNAEKEIKSFNKSLEQRVIERTEKLEKKNIELIKLMAERKKMEVLLLKQKKDLEQKNIALSELLGQLELEKKYIKDNVIANAENLLLPIIQKLKLKGESRMYVKLLQKNLQELTSSFGTRLIKEETKLTAREIEICNMIKNGLTSKEICSLLNISSRTTEKHRANIRRKLGIINKDINLASFLKSH